MSNFFGGLVVIFTGGLLGYILRTAIPQIITATDTVEQVAFRTFIPLVVFILSLILGIMVMVGRFKLKPRGK
jgi:hypothetical protein